MHGIDFIDVDPFFGEQHYSTVFADLQVSPRAKLLDLRAAKIEAVFFERLTAAWQGANAVPQLAFLLRYDRWVMLREEALVHLHPLRERGIAVELFYTQQCEQIWTWFATGKVQHAAHAVVKWLSDVWSPTPIWPSILSKTAVFVEEAASVGEVPDLLIDLATMALSHNSAEGAAHAIKHLRTALHWIGDTSSSARARALRTLAAVAQFNDTTEPARDLLKAAISVAAAVPDHTEHAYALTELGFLNLRTGHPARAERRFRKALALLPSDQAVSLRSVLHHNLLLAMHERRQRKAERARRTATLG